MNQKYFSLTLIFLCLCSCSASGQLMLQKDSLINLVIDGDFDQPCLDEAIYLPYQVETEGHNNSPDLVVFQMDSTGGQWYWDEFGCLKDRYFLPFLPLHYACCRMRQEPPVPPAYSGDRYACLIREPQINEALVYQLTSPVLPGQPYRVFFAARAMSPFCPRPTIRVSVSATEPCRGSLNSLEDGAMNACKGNRSFQPKTILQSDTLPLNWIPFEEFLLASDTIKWIIFSAGPVDTTNGLPYLGIDDIQVQPLPIPSEITAPTTQHKFGETLTWTLTFRNPHPVNIIDYPVVIYPDDKLAVIDCPGCDSLLNDGGIRLNIDIPPGTPQKPTVISTVFTWRSLSDCPMRSLFVFGQKTGERWPFRVEIKQPDPSPIIYIPDSTLSLTNAIEKNLLPTDSIQGKEIFINGDFFLNATSYQFTDCLIRVRWGSQLVIPSEGSISLIRTEFQGCGQPWESLRIMDEGALYLEDSLIREAKTALRYRQGATVRMRGSNLEGEIMDMDLELDQPPNQKDKKKRK